MIRHTTDGAVRVSVYEGLSAVYAATAKSKTWPSHYSFSGMSQAERVFMETRLGTRDAARDTIQEPWTEGRKMICEMRDEILNAADITPPQNTRRVRRWSDADGEVVVDRVMSGDAAYMETRRREWRAGPSAVAIMIPLGGSHIYSNQELLWKGAAGAALIELVEEAGYGCEVWGYSNTLDSYRVSPRNSFTAVRVKDAGELVDTDALCKLVAPWFFRTVIISSKGAAGDLTSTFGRPDAEERVVRPLAAKHLDIPAGVPQVYCPLVFTRTDAVRKTKELIANLNLVRDK